QNRREHADGIPGNDAAGSKSGQHQNSAPKIKYQCEKTKITPLLGEQPPNNLDDQASTPRDSTEGHRKQGEIPVVGLLVGVKARPISCQSHGRNHQWHQTESNKASRAAVPARIRRRQVSPDVNERKPGATKSD